MIIEAKLVHIDAKKDVLRFSTNPIVDVAITETTGVNDLKALFTSLLSSLLADCITVELINNQDFQTQMYVDVCTEYIAALNAELVSAREQLIAEGLADAQSVDFV